MASALRRRIRRIAWAGAKRCLPMPLLYEIWSRNTARHWRTDLATATDVRAFDAGPGVRILAYWSDVPRVGKGPSASVYVREEEVFRVDVFGNDQATMHVNPDQIALQAGTTRFLLPAADLDDPKIGRGPPSRLPGTRPGPAGAQHAAAGCAAVRSDPTALGARGRRRWGAHWLLLGRPPLVGDPCAAGSGPDLRRDAKARSRPRA